MRGTSWASNLTKLLVKSNISPNQISVGSVLFSLLAGIGFICFRNTEGQWHYFIPIFVVVMIQCRLLCNLFDGMVAVEGGKASKVGNLYNEIPDRIADSVILICAGYAVPNSEMAIALGWAAALLAAITAYVRTLSAATGAPMNFAGPMAKQHRMATLTIACILTVFEPMFAPKGIILTFALGLITLGSAVTIYRRTQTAAHFLNSR